MNSECRECSKVFRIKESGSLTRSYKNGVRCIDCWLDSKKTSESLSKTMTGGLYRFTKEDVAQPATESDNDFFLGDHSVGDKVYLNTNLYGVVEGSIVACEDFGYDGAYIFYAVDIKGVIIDYIDSLEVHKTKKEAESSVTITKI